MRKLLRLPAKRAVPTVEELMEEFLTDLENAGRSPHTLVNYRADLRRFLRDGHAKTLNDVTPDVLRRYFTTLGRKAPATRARHQASLNAFLEWCVKYDWLPSNPMDKIDRVKVPEPLPKGLPDETIHKILAAIPRENLRDRLLFTLIAETGVRIAEALGIYVEDLDLTPDDEKILVRGKGNKTRTVMLYSSPTTLRLLRRYMQQSNLRSGPLFRSTRGRAVTTMHYRTAHAAWTKYCRKAGVTANIHALRHSFATSLINKGVRLEIVRKLLGHKNMHTTLRYAEVNDQTIKTELRQKWREVRFRQA